MSQRAKTRRKMYADSSFEAFNSTYDEVEGFDSILRDLTGKLSIFCEVIRGSLYGSELTLDILLSGTKNFTIVLKGNLMEIKESKNERMRKSLPL
jgi:hypothetical protein